MIDAERLAVPELAKGKGLKGLKEPKGQKGRLPRLVLSVPLVPSSLEIPS